MARRKIITIDRDACTGCGNCVTGCAEGALRIEDGKARLVKERFCDGFGDCIGACPTGALRIEERDCDEFDLRATTEHLRKTKGEAAVTRMEEANLRHTQRAEPRGCPSATARTQLPTEAALPPVPANGIPPRIHTPELSQWPVQLHLVQPGAPFFAGRELVLLSTCSPIASADVHWRFMRGRAVVVACPKLDRTEGYVEKLAEIIREAAPPRVLVVRMEVPCCGGLTAIAKRALDLSGQRGVRLDEVTLSLAGEVIGEVALRDADTPSA